MHLDATGNARWMRGRWGESPEPTKPIIAPGTGEIASITLQDVPDSIDIPPYDHATLDIALKLDVDTECYGWNTEGYFHPQFKNRNWLITEKRALVKVRVATGGREFLYRCQLVNDAQLNLLSLPR